MNLEADMPGWVPVVAAIALVTIAGSVAFFAAVLFLVLKEARLRGEALGREVSQLRADIGPTLDAVKTFGERGAELAKVAEGEAHQIIEATRKIRYDVERGMKRAKRRLAEFDAVVGVVQEEVEATAVELSSALESARSGIGALSSFGKLVRPRRKRRGAA